MARTAIVLGAGVGGLSVANELRKRVARNDRIVLIDRSDIHLFQSSLLWLAVGSRTAKQIQKPVHALLRRGIEFLHGNVETIDPANRTVTVNGARMHADANVIALGAELAAESIPGLAEAGHNLYALGGAQSLHEALETFQRGRLVILTASPLFKCPAAPFEAAMLIEDRLRRRRFSRARQMEMHGAEPAPMAVAGPAVSGAVKTMLADKGIAYTPNHQVTSVDPNSRTLTFADGASVAYDLLAYVPPHRAPKVIAASGLSGETGWIPVDRSTLATSFEGVYAIGDVATIPLLIGKPLPKAGVFAHAQAAVVACNIANAWQQKPNDAAFNGHGACFLETGGGKAAIGMGNFFAEPNPSVALKPPSVFWHLAKVIFEKRWLRQWPFAF